MNKILFIVPPNSTFNCYTNPSYNERVTMKKCGNFGSIVTDMPLGILSMSAYVKKYTETESILIDFNVILNKMNDFKFNSFVELFNSILSDKKYIEYNPDIISISSLFTPSYQNMIDIAKVCRSIFPKILIISGGGVPTNMYNEIFQNNSNPSLDALCYGEGEIPLRLLIESKDKFQHIENSSSWITHTKVKNNQSFQHTVIENLDEIPFYDYDICKIEDYELNPSITAYASIDKKNKIFHVMTSRGCTHHCCFCSSHTVHGRKMRYHSIERVKEDFKILKEKYEAKIIIFQDDNLMSNKERVYKIIDIIKELNLTVIFQNALAMYALDRKMLESLKSAGVNQISLSVESGSDRVLKEIMHKPLNTSIIKRVIDDCRELNIYTNVAVLIGLPGETKYDIEVSRQFLKTTHANWFLIFCASPLIGSEMYEICCKKNYIKGDYIGIDYKRCVVETEDFTSEYIEKIVYFLNLELNFMENGDYHLGNYITALKGFEHTINIKNDHAIAYYCAARCYEKLGNLEKYQQYINKVKIIIKENPFWSNYINMFNVKL